jgi:hypothetical protein
MRRLPKVAKWPTVLRYLVALGGLGPSLFKCGAGICGRRGFLGSPQLGVVDRHRWTSRGSRLFHDSPDHRHRTAIQAQGSEPSRRPSNRPRSRGFILCSSPESHTKFTAEFTEAHVSKLVRVDFSHGYRYESGAGRRPGARFLGLRRDGCGRERTRRARAGLVETRRRRCW